MGPFFQGGNTCPYSTKRGAWALGGACFILSAVPCSQKTKPAYNVKRGPVLLLLRLYYIDTLLTR